MTRMNNSANTCGKILSLPLSRHNTHNRANKSEDGFERHVMTTKRVTELRAPSECPAPAPAGLSVSRGLGSLVCTALSPVPSLTPLSLTADTGTGPSRSADVDL